MYKDQHKNLPYLIFYLQANPSKNSKRFHQHFILMYSNGDSVLYSIVYTKRLIFFILNLCMLCK